MTRVVRIHVGVSRELQLKLEAGSISVSDFTHAIGLSKVDTLIVAAGDTTRLIRRLFLNGRPGLYR